MSWLYSVSSSNSYFYIIHPKCSESITPAFSKYEFIIQSVALLKVPEGLRHEKAEDGNFNVSEGGEKMKQKRNQYPSALNESLQWHIYR